MHGVTKVHTNMLPYRKNKSDNIIKEIGGAGDGENLIQCTLCDAKVSPSPLYQPTYLIFYTRYYLCYSVC